MEKIPRQRWTRRPFIGCVPPTPQTSTPPCGTCAPASTLPQSLTSILSSTCSGSATWQVDTAALAQLSLCPCLSFGLWPMGLALAIMIAERRRLFFSSPCLAAISARSSSCCISCCCCLVLWLLSSRSLMYIAAGLQHIHASIQVQLVFYEAPQL